MYAHPRVPNRYSTDTPLKGCLVLVVGPSGVDKDSLIDGARALLDGDGFVFPQREITRPADAGGESHVAVTESQFHARRELGGYLLSWGAHGLWYGIPTEVAADLGEGRTVVVNASRTMIGEARDRFANLRIVSVNAADETLRARLAARAREDQAEVDRRLERARAFRVEGEDVIPFSNDGALDEALERFADMLRSCADRP